MDKKIVIIRTKAGQQYAECIAEKIKNLNNQH